MALKRYHLGFAGCALLAVGVALYCCYAPVSSPDAQLPISVHVRPAPKGERDSYPGTLIPIRVGSLKANTTGRIVKVHVKTGDRVRAGDLLCELYDKIYSAQLESARAKLRLAESRYRARSAAANAAGDLDEVKIKLSIAKADADAAEAECASAEHRLADTKIRAPFDGTIMEILIEKDATVDPFDPQHCRLFALADLSAFLAQVDFPQNMWRRLRKGQRARIEIPSFPETRFEGEVLDLDTHINVDTGRFAVRFKIEPAERGELLMAGMFAVVSLNEEETVSEKTPH